MTWVALCLVGIGLGVLFFGMLGLSLRLAFRHPRLAPILAASGLARFGLLGGALALLAGGHAELILAVLGGILIGRWLCLSWVRERGLGR
jgi:N-ATPase, AtpR subunit